MYTHEVKSLLVGDEPHLKTGQTPYIVVRKLRARSATCNRKPLEFLPNLNVEREKGWSSRLGYYLSKPVGT